MATTDNLLESLHDLIAHCHKIRMSLINDNENFIKQDMTKLEASNQDKKSTLNDLEKLIKDLSQAARSEHKISFMERVEQARNQADTYTQQQFDQALAELKNEVSLCYQSIAVNSTIVVANINHLERTWDQLLSTRPKMDKVYDSKGKV